MVNFSFSFIQFSLLETNQEDSTPPPSPTPAPPSLATSIGNININSHQQDDDNEDESKDSAEVNWHHGTINRNRAEMLLKAVGTRNCWLVRDSIHFRGDYTITMLLEGATSATPIRVRTDYVNDRRVFFIHANSDVHPQCDSLRTLIDYYRQNPIAPNIGRLGAPVPVPPRHEREPWFYAHDEQLRELTRDIAEQALKSPEVADGQFLVREKKNKDAFGLSFRLERAPGVVEVKHALISYNREMCTYRFGDVDFAQLSSLVEYYQHNTFYQRRRLSTPIERRIVNAKLNQVTSSGVEHGSDYVEQKFVVLYQYEAERNDELTIRPGDIIRDVQKRSQAWWFGTLEGQDRHAQRRQGYFPTNYVKEHIQTAESTQCQDLLEQIITKDELQLQARYTLAEMEHNDGLIIRDGNNIQGQLVIKRYNHNDERESTFRTLDKI